MALTDKNIQITPNKGVAADPVIVFSGADASLAAQNISLNVYPTNSGTLSFEGSAGQLFSVSNSLAGTIFSVNDISGIPSIEVLDSGVVKIGQYSGNVVIGSATDNGSGKLQVTGAVSATSFIGNGAGLTSVAASSVNMAPSVFTSLGASLTQSNAALIYNSTATLVPLNGVLNFIPWIATKSVLSGGYNGNSQIGEIRHGTAGWQNTSGVYIAPGGGSDTASTEYFGLTYGGGIEHSNTEIELRGMTYDTNLSRFVSPKGGSYVTTTSTVVGAIGIILPTAGVTSTSMLKMVVKVYNYVLGWSIDVHISSHLSIGTWVNPTVYILGDSDTPLSYIIRYGTDTATGSPIVYIGELAQSWNYPQVFVTEFQTGYATSALYKKGWRIIFEPTAFQNLQPTYSKVCTTTGSKMFSPLVVGSICIGGQVGVAIASGGSTASFTAWGITTNASNTIGLQTGTWKNIGPNTTVVLPIGLFQRTA
jgi:hypothetical protein